ncbi:hypothetical protein [uncultured Pedobacter sp.]|uniref:hypothetical protein n=1 Tax=uncultured Pedobacter sp. TaxID=246139 RepID=UPI00260A81F6|nr:hypothetical protein [uncultured Pedobacter sp.]
MKTNYQWENVGEHGAFAHGYVDLFKTTVKEKKAYAIINYLPQFEDKDSKVVLTLLLEGEEGEWTKGEIKSMMYDAEERVREVARVKFKIHNVLDYMTAQFFYLKDVDGFAFGNSADFAFEKRIT